MIRVCVSGGFDPLHIGHIKHLEEASKLGDYLIVILTRNEQLVTKKGYYFMDYRERKELLEWGLKDKLFEIVPNIDKDITSVESLRTYKPSIFAKGGDRIPENMVQGEIEACKEIGCKIVYGVGEKLNSSSKLVSEAASKIIERGIRPSPGHFIVALDIDGTLLGYEGSITIDQINRLWKENVIPGILCSRSIESSKQVCQTIGFNAQFVRQCEVNHRAPYLRQLANDIHRQFYVYVADREIDKIEATRAGWDFYYPQEIESLINRIQTTPYVKCPKNLKDGCPLCHYVWKTRLYFETDKWRAMECLTCQVPIISDREHNPNWDEQSRREVTELRDKYFPNRSIRWEARKVLGHRHIHVT